jgi:DNA replication protein DnaC
MTIDDKVCSLLLFGKSRTGKTAAAWAAIKKLWSEEPETDVLFTKSVTFIRLAKARHLSAEAREQFSELFDKMLKVDLLVLDDLGSEGKLKESADEVLFELVDSRTEEWLRTIITTNSSAEELANTFMEKNGEKILARLREFFLPVRFNP